MSPFSRFSIVVAIALFLQYSAVGARSPDFSRVKSRSSFIHYGISNLGRNKIIPASTLADDRYERVIPRDYAQRSNHDEIFSLNVIQKLRGGDTMQELSMCKVSRMIESLDIFGTAVFAFSGALKAGRKGMDLIGMMIIACITAVGGGTLRDVLMMGGGEEHVVFWMQTPLYLEISLVTALATFYLWPKLEARFGLEDSSIPICTSDALGLAAFCVVGVQAAARRGLAPTLWVVSGLMTATFGGIIRDVICGEQPRIMYPHRTLYALGPAMGALTYTILENLRNTHSLPLNNSSTMLASFLVAFVVRVLSFNKPWRMPHWNVKKTE